VQNKTCRTFSTQTEAYNPFSMCIAGGCVWDSVEGDVTHTALCLAYDQPIGAAVDDLLGSMCDDSLFLDTYGLVDKLERATRRLNSDMNQPKIRAAAALLFARRELEAYIKSSATVELPESKFRKEDLVPFDHYMRLRCENLNEE
jgi:hypothetical protein